MELTIEQALQQGVTAHKEGKLEDAERLYCAILQSQPTHPDANHNLGVIAVSVNKADAALPLFKTAVEANPKVEQFWLSYIDALIKEKQFDNARQILEQAKKQGVPRDKVDAIEGQIIATTQVNEPKLVVQKKNLTLSEKRKKLAEQKKNKKKAKTQNLKGISPSQEELSSLLEHYQNERFDDAEKLAVSITNEFPKHQFGWKVLGAVLKQTGRVSESLVASQTSVQLAPQDAEAQNNLGNTLQELGRLDEAKASYIRAITVRPDLADAHSNLGNTFQKLGRFDEAEASYTRALMLKPDYAETHNNLGATLKQLGRLDEAEASYTQAIALAPEFTEAHYNLGNTLKELGRLNEAEVSYTQAISLKPDYAEAYSNLGTTLEELRRFDEAEVSYKQAIALKPDYAEAHSNLGNTLKELGKLNEAEASYTQAIALKPDFALAHSHLSKVLYFKGYKDLAIESIGKANHFDPQSKDFRLLLSVMKSRKSREGSEVSIGDTGYIGSFTGLPSNPFKLQRAVEVGLITKLYAINSTVKKKVKNDARFGTRSSEFNLLKDSSPIIQSLAADLTKIMMEAVKSDVYIYDSFFNILGAGGGTKPHRHLNDLDRDINLNLGKQKYSLQYYLSVGDQNCSEPGMLKLYEPVEDILPSEGLITIIPASRIHSAVYNGKTDRVMIGINFYSL